MLGIVLQMEVVVECLAELVENSFISWMRQRKTNKSEFVELICEMRLCHWR